MLKVINSSKEDGNQKFILQISKSPEDILYERFGKMAWGIYFSTASHKVRTAILVKKIMRSYIDPKFSSDDLTYISHDGETPPIEHRKLVDVADKYKYILTYVLTYNLSI